MVAVGKMLLGCPHISESRCGAPGLPQCGVVCESWRLEQLLAGVPTCCPEPFRPFDPAAQSVSIKPLLTRCDADTGTERVHFFDLIWIRISTEEAVCGREGRGSREGYR